MEQRENSTAIGQETTDQSLNIHCPKEMSEVAEVEGSADIDVIVVENSWTPDRKERTENRIRGFLEGPLRDGDFVLNADGLATTLSFCFERDSNWFGVTTGRLADIGDPIYGFTGHSNEDGHNSVRQIGVDKSKSTATNSLVFSIDVSEQMKTTNMLLAEKSGLGNQNFILPTATSPAPAASLVVIGYATQRRGAIGNVYTPALSGSLAGLALTDDVGISDGENSQLTDDGDCGAIFVDEHGVGVSMHHVLRQTGDFYESFGVSLKSILAAHSLLGGTDATTQAFHETHHTSSRTRDFRETHNILHFSNLVFENHAVLETHNMGPPTKLFFG